MNWIFSMENNNKFSDSLKPRTDLFFFSNQLKWIFFFFRYFEKLTFSKRKFYENFNSLLVCKKKVCNNETWRRNKFNFSMEWGSDGVKSIEYFSKQFLLMLSFIDENKNVFWIWALDYDMCCISYYERNIFFSYTFT